MTHRDGAAVRVHPRVVVGDAEVLEEREHLDGERLVDLERCDVVDAQPGLAQRLLGGGDRPRTHHLGLDPGEGVRHEPHPHRETELAGLTIDDIQAFEVNEAFAVQVLAFLQHYGIADDDPRVNPYGGAIAVGHPLASSGVRLMTQLARQFEERPAVRYGLTTMCIGIGMGGTVIWENPYWKGAAA